MDTASGPAIRRAMAPHGIAHREQLRAAGARMRDIRTLVDRGVLQRIRRDWFATTGCHGLVVRAAYAGATLSCTSAATVLGLWEVGGREVHVAAGRGTTRIHREPLATHAEGLLPLRVHWTRDPMPPAAPRARALIDDISRVLVAVAACCTLEESVAVIDSALRRGAITMFELRQLAERSSAVRRVIDFVHPASDSGYESDVRVRLARRGVTMVPQVVIDGHPVDGLIGSRLVLQIDGYGPHSDRRTRNRDLAQDERLRRIGHIVLRFSADQVRREWPMVESAVLSVIAAGRHNF
ncbi:DUF559 domain-containing protein [Agromyces protaetiae]|uniref:DUF559 domain-containing protein n=1 Tax=Agromyces protaetiae TaxID=2509455 RepID=A0A4P6FJC2_9MICO|nr:DUF559 domain-containing protein [Agromyces protaetiae]QAY74699.1 DUF559 domain-containing protein [Agromyces protaetiae]